MTKDKALKLALEALRKARRKVLTTEECHAVIMSIKEVLAQPEQEPVAVYGYCPECGAEGVARERRPNGNDCCANGHTYPSRNSNKTPQRKPLTDEQKLALCKQFPDHLTFDAISAIEAAHGIKE